MPTELEELVEFLHHGNQNIRRLAAENLVGYSIAQPAIFKTTGLTPIKDLKLLVKDHADIAKNALTMLINLSGDPLVLQNLATDDEFVSLILTRVSDPKANNPTELSILIANLTKHPSLTRIITLSLPSRSGLTASSPDKLPAIDILLALFLLADPTAYNKNVDPLEGFDHLSYAFAELGRLTAARTYLTTPRPDDEDRIPLTKIAVFTEASHVVRRRGVASAIKNVCFEVSAHKIILGIAPSGPDSETEHGILPYILLPLMSGSTTFKDEETFEMPEDVQLLPPEKKRESDNEIVKIHLDSLLLLCSSREGREKLREAQTYPIIRELHVEVEDEDVREGCDRVVQILMRDEADDEASRVEEIVEDEDEMVIDVL